jgi:DNA modification methylase
MLPGLLPPTTVLCGDVLEQLRTLTDESVQCCVTSPPYWGLRKYIDDDSPLKPFEIGLESTPEKYVAKMVAVFREVRRVLRNDGMLWLNLGDTYNNFRVSMNGQSIHNGEQRDKPPGCRAVDRQLKEKDLVGIPWRVAFALQKDGWWLRSDIIWHKPNPMPESVTDRPTKSHEYLFLLTKAARYYYDAEAVKEGVSESQIGRVRSDEVGGKSWKERQQHGKGGTYVSGRAESTQIAGCGNNGGALALFGEPCEGAGGFGSSGEALQPQPEMARLDERVNGERIGTRNLRSVWTIATQAYPEAHFATFPEALVYRCLAAGTSAWGCCATCGAAWERILEKESITPMDYDGKNSTQEPQHSGRRMLANVRARRIAGEPHDNPFPSPKTTGWHPTCSCPPSAPVPCTVLDPFAGSGTSLLVARRMGLASIGIELNPEYVELIRRRLL